MAYIYHVKNAPCQPSAVVPKRDQTRMKWYACALSVVLAAVLIIPHLPTISFPQWRPATTETPQGNAQVRLVACDWRSTRLFDGSDLFLPGPGSRMEFYRAYITRPSGRKDYCEFSYDPRDGSSLITHLESDASMPYPTDTRYRAFGSSPDESLSTWLQGKAQRLSSAGEDAREIQRIQQSSPIPPNVIISDHPLPTGGFNGQPIRFSNQ